MKRTWLAVALGLSLGLAGGARADVWDSASDSDDGIGTDNELITGSNQVHDLGVRPGPVADQDWYRIVQRPFSSWEVVIDGTTGDVGIGLDMTRVQSDGTTVLQTSTPIDGGLGYSRTMTWANATSTAVTQFVRVFGAACGTNCTSSDQYRLRALETTISVARYNTSGGQITVCFLMDLQSTSVSGNLHLWNLSSTLVGSVPFTVTARDVDSFNLNTVSAGAFNNTNGAITITHNGRHGQVGGKCTALDPPTGFSFDTPLVIVPN